jgi:hypothetical protein
MHLSYCECRQRMVGYQEMVASRYAIILNEEYVSGCVGSAMSDDKKTIIPVDMPKSE